MTIHLRIVAVCLTTAVLLLTMTMSVRQCTHQEQPTREESVLPPAESHVPDVTGFLNSAIAHNSDALGWLQVPGTGISEAVYQSDDNAFYNRRDASKEYSYPGSVYMDYECVTTPRLSQNLIIYGHNLGYPWGIKDAPELAESGKFGPLLKFDDIVFARAHPYIFFTTPERDYIYEIFAVLYTEADVRPLAYILPQYSRNDFEKLITDMRSRSQFRYNVSLSETDKIITLSTCTHKYGTYEENPDQRFVVMGRLTRKGDTLYETADIRPNPSPKEPEFQLAL